MKIPFYMEVIVGVSVVLLSYFIGNVNSAILLSKMKGKDIRTCGSGNPGTMNMIRTFGKPMAAITLILDVAKGVVPSVLGWLFMGTGQFCTLGSDRIGLYVAGLAVELGHIYPAVYKFKGGKGVATLFGVCLTFQPIAMIVSFGVGVVLLIFSQRGALTSFFMMSVPLALEGIAAASSPMGYVSSLLIFAMFALTLFAHRTNLVTMFAGNERRVVLKKSHKVKPLPDISILVDEPVIVE